jgi:hypothetical protein
MPQMSVSSRASSNSFFPKLQFTLRVVVPMSQ